MIVDPRIHQPTSDGWWLAMPLLSGTRAAVRVTGTWWTPHPVRLKTLALTLTPAQLDLLLDFLPDHVERVFVLDRAHLQYSASLVSLPDDLAEHLHFDRQVRCDAHGEIVARNEICIADELLAERWLAERGVQRATTPRQHPVPAIAIDEAWALVRDADALPDDLTLSTIVAYRDRPKLRL